MDDATRHGRAAENAAAEEAAVARLRAADPAATAEPDLPALRTTVDARRTVETNPTVPDDLAARRSRRPVSWPARIAGAAAAALVVGAGGGYAIGAAGGSDAASSAEPAITLQGAGERGGDESTADMAAPMPMSAADASRSSFWPGGWGGRTIFTSSGLSDAGGTLHAWGLDAAASFTEQTVATAAGVLGVAGAAQLVDGVWSVGPSDGTGPTVQVHPDGTASLNYYDPAKDVWYCPAVLVDPEMLREMELDPSFGVETTAPDEGAAIDDGAASEEGSEGSAGAEDSTDTSPDDTSPDTAPAIDLPALSQSCEERDLGAAPQGDAAVGQLRDLLTALGQDAAGFEYVNEENWGDETWSYVTAYQVLDGQRTGLSWSATLTGAGVQSVYGPTAPLVDLGEYEVISPVAAVERLSDPRFAGWSGPIFLRASAESLETTDEIDPSVPPGVPPTVQPGAAIEWPVSQATIVEARLGLALQTQADGAALLVPTYELTSDEGAVWTVIAVTEAHLDFAAGQ